MGGNGGVDTALAHGDGCGCQRCRGFEPGNGVAERHGSYAVIGLREPVLEMAEAIEDWMRDADVYRRAFTPTIAACAIVFVRLLRAEAALAKLDEAGGDTARLRQDAKGWANTLRGYLADLGLSGTALARIAKDTGIGRATRASAAMQRLEQHIEGEYGAGRPVEAAEASRERGEAVSTGPSEPQS